MRAASGVRERRLHHRGQVRAAVREAAHGARRRARPKSGTFC